ncbi:hypothetical protein BPS13_0158 [Bacillus phage BPS13]|uniref:Uncharacterized protein n=1 Tax=Bacillus phage BPS13 TaxID=1136731 RepID=J9PU98_9CAUD|nr:hypothetical protein BPS13_0158 [Bacillus phage BPS13]AEZ50337.1 hypothetical protein BPS13_0158 [Bacillus phage BPS13]
MFKDEREYELERRQKMAMLEMMKCMVMVLAGFPIAILLLIVLKISGVL